MPAKTIRVNLIGQGDLEHTPWGRLITWATTYGRYIMITTEIVVLLAFISRFSLDRKLTDLKEEISQKQAIIEANFPFESEYREVQKKLEQVSQLLKQQRRPIDVLTVVHGLLPPDVYLSSFEVAKDTVTVNAVADTSTGFGQFLANAKASKEVRGVTLGNISKTPGTGISFQLTASLTQKKGK